LGVQAVFANRDYEPQAKARDNDIASRLSAQGQAFYLSKDQVIFEQDEILTQAGRPYSVFTPYKNAWLKRLTPYDVSPWPADGALASGPLATCVPTLAELGFSPVDTDAGKQQTGMSGARRQWAAFQEDRLQHYDALRDFPAVDAVSHLSTHLRFGTLSIRELVRAAQAAQAEVWLNELIWREFYFMILDQFPHVSGHAFKAEYDDIQWEQGPEANEHFAAWCEGRTGYPLIDAAMRQLNDSGWMHNRLRMVTASFLCKDLGIDWRRGEAYFAAQLNDFDQAANNGGWQWAASSGCDAQPWFRIFNPVTQSQKFDTEGVFIRQHVPELCRVLAPDIHEPWKMSTAKQNAAGVIIGRDYPAPIVDHATARERTLQRYAAARKTG